jgi:LuxR family maltose regulon positive regulatory protein
MGEDMSTRIVLADNHAVFRHHVRVLLDKEPNLCVVAEAEDGQSALRLARELRPDLVVMDVVMANLSGIEATRLIVSSDPSVKVIALSMHADKAFVESMLRAGATGYVLKENASTELTRAIRAVTTDQIYLSAGLPRISI